MIAVTGASGRIGQWVVARLTELGHDVVCLSRRPSAEPELDAVRWSRPVGLGRFDLADPSSIPELARTLRPAVAVVHLAAFVPENSARAEHAVAILDANVRGTVNLLRALRDAESLETVVLASSFEVYGPPSALPIAETHATRPMSFYGASKLAAEKYLAIFARERGLAASAIRMPAVYGPGDSLPRALGNFIRAAAAGSACTIHGDGNDVRDLVYAGDAAEAIAAAVDRRARGIFNVGSGRGFRVREMAEAVSRVAERSLVVSWRERTKTRADYVLSIERARAELGWEPRVSLDEGIRAQLDWNRRRRAFMSPIDARGADRRRRQGLDS